MNDFSLFLEQLFQYGLEHFRKFYGVYRGSVVTNKDPQARGRIKVSVPEAGHLKGRGPDRWVDPAWVGAGKDIGVFWPPEEDEMVWVVFAQGDPSRPHLYFGGWFARDEVPKKLGYQEGAASDEEEGKDEGTLPMRRGLRTKAGHTLVFNDEEGKESIEVYWKDESAFVTIDPKAKITVQTANSYLFMDVENKKIECKDENGSVCTLDAAGVTVKSSKDILMTGQKVVIKADDIYLDSPKVRIDTGGSQGVPRGEDLLQWLNSHKHPTGVGPSGPAVALNPATPPLLSSKAKVD